MSPEIFLFAASIGGFVGALATPVIKDIGDAVLGWWRRKGMVCVEHGFYRCGPCLNGSKPWHVPPKGPMARVAP